MSSGPRYASLLKEVVVSKLQHRCSGIYRISRHEIFLSIFFISCLLEIMIFILLPLLTRALNVTGHARTDIQGRFWEETYDCQGKGVQLLV